MDGIKSIFCFVANHNPAPKKIQSQARGGTGKTIA
jgi:hypothetical protein